MQAASAEVWEENLPDQACSSSPGVKVRMQQLYQRHVPCSYLPAAGRIFMLQRRCKAPMRLHSAWRPRRLHTTHNLHTHGARTELTPVGNGHRASLLKREAHMIKP